MPSQCELTVQIQLSITFDAMDGPVALIPSMPITRA
jgi:hypothetical protein